MAESHHEDNNRKGSSTSRKKRRCLPDDDLKFCIAYLYRKDGCPRGEECNFLHMCRYYMVQYCIAGRTCQFSHDLSTRQCQAWFQRRFGIQFGRVQGEMLHQFRYLFKAAMCQPPKDKTSDESARQNWKERQRSLERLRGFLASLADAEKGSAVGESLQTDEDKVSRSAETSYAAKTAQTHRGRQKPKGDKTGKVCIPSKSSVSDTNQTTDSLVSSTAPMTSSSSVNAPTVKPESSPEFPPQICLYYLRGSCSFSEHKHQKYRHCAHPFQWEIQDGMRGIWLDLTDQANVTLEQHFCNVTNAEYSGQLIAYCGENRENLLHVRTATITFGVVTLAISDKSGQLTDVRRLSSVSYTQAGGWIKTYSTQWTWYWQDGQKKWIEYPQKKPGDSSLNTTNDTIEKMYLKFRQQKGPAGIEITTDQGKWRLNFSHMEQTSLSEGPAQVQPLARRPKWKPTSNQCPSDAPSVPAVEVNSTVKASLPQKTPEESRAPIKKPLEPKLSVTQQIDHSRKPGAQNVLNSKTQDVLVSSDSKELNKPQLSACPSQKQHPDVLDSKKPQSAPIQETDASNGTRFKTLGAFVRPTGDRALHQDVDSQLQEPSSLTAESKPGSLPRLTKVASPGSSADKVVTNKSDASPDRERKECLEICLHYLKGSCQVEDDKYTHERHFTTPYQWQEPLVQSGRCYWRNCSSDINNCLEKEYSHVEYDIHVNLIDVSPECEVFRFLDLSLYRRLSTPSSVLASSWEKAFSIEWIWYWLDEKNHWIAYSEKNPKGERAGINSATIERKYLNYKSKREDPEIEFTAGRENYKLDFAAMHQTNVRYGTCRKVRRRPKIVSMEDRMRLSRRFSEAPKVGHIVPATWEGVATQTDMKLVPLTDRTSTEYKDIAKLFEDTMGTRGSIISIKRVQNMDLWEDFTKMSERMRKRNDGSPVLQMQLLHGTTTISHAHAICRQNFDWRLSGSNVGTVCGKGSYFARDAKFAHRYTKPNDKNDRYLLVAQVLVGSCAMGSPVYTRPPPKDPLKPHGDLYDSCVNDVTDPAIFVIFEMNQAYPEYLIKYKENPGYELPSLGSSSSSLAALSEGKIFSEALNGIQQ